MRMRMMKTKRHVVAAVALFFAAGFAAPALAQSDFDDAGDTAGWTVDRYAPDDFDSGVSFDSRLVLEQDIGPLGDPANRPPVYSGAFYNTQGMQSTAFAPGTTSMSIELYVPGAWSLTNQRMAGFWGIGSPIAYPIIEYSSDALFGAGWRGWDANVGWINLGNAVTYDGWNTLSIALNGGNWDYAVNGATLGSVSAGSSTSLSRAILQGHNTGATTPYSIHWDNLSTPAVPEPATWAMMLLGFGVIGGGMRSRRKLGGAAPLAA